jgi:hypothetical protein
MFATVTTVTAIDRGAEDYRLASGAPAPNVDALSLQLHCEDDAASASPGGTDFYYVRLIQRNGQRAWSSPIFVES